MRELLGFPLSVAEERLRAEGYEVTSVETRSRKGQPGNELRVLRAKEMDGRRVELVYARFKTDLFWMPE